MWGVTAPVGTPLSLELFLSGADAGADSVTTAWSIRAAPEEEVEEEEGEVGGEDAHTDPAVAAAGLLSGVRLSPSSSSPLSLVFLRPGLFRVGGRAPRVEGGRAGRVGLETLWVRAE